MRSFFETSYPGTGSRGSLAPMPTDYIDARVLSAGIAEVHPIPADARYVVFSGSGEFYARFGASSVFAATPASDVLDGTAPELNPGARTIPADATHIALVAPTATNLTLSFYAA